MAPPNRARQYGGGKGGFDLGALLLAGAGMPQANPDFGQDQETANVTQGKNVDVESPYKKPSWIGRYAGNNANQLNMEYKLGKESMLMQQQFQQDLEKIRLANELVRIGANTEAEKVIAGVKDGFVRGQQQQAHGFRIDEQALDNLNRLGQIELTGQEARKTGQQSSDLLLRNQSADNLEKFNMGQGLYPDSVPTPENRAALQSNFSVKQSLVPRNLEAQTKLAEGQALVSAIRDIGASGTIDFASPGRTAFLPVKGTEGNELLGTRERDPEMITQQTRVTSPLLNSRVDTSQVIVDPGIGMNNPADQGGNPSERGPVKITAKPPAAAQTIGLPEDYDTKAKRLKKKRSLEETNSLLPLVGSWPPR